MRYEISNNHESIRFQGGGKEVVIYKWAIREIILVRDDLIRFNIGDSGIIFHHADVNAPETPSAEELLSMLNEWISNFAPPSI